MYGEVDRVWRIMSDIKICMLITIAGSKIHARPMSTILRREQNDIVMLTEKASRKESEVAHDSTVVLNFCDGSHDFVSLQGNARMSDDRALLKELWNPGAQAFWPEGPEKANVEAVIVNPVEAEYWASSSGLLSSVKMAFAIATGQTPDLGEHKKVGL